MGDFIKSAFNFISSASSLKNGPDYIGRTLEVSGRQVHIRKLLAKGGFSLIYEANELTTNRPCAIKRILVHSSDSQAVIYQEIKFMKMLMNHPNILEFFYAARIKAEGHDKLNEFLIVTELCQNGNMSQYMPQAHSSHLLSMENIIKVFYQTCLAVEYMHTRPEKLIHRDLKIENILISDKLMVKLCDFGSTATDRHFPDSGWSLLERKTLQDQIETVTTPMYRPPEVLDLFLNYPITEAMDIWAMGCILFYLTANFHPFEDSSKLAILNAKYSMPNLHRNSHHILESLISVMLLLDPTMRPSIQEIISNISEIAKVQEIYPNDPLYNLKQKSFILIGGDESVPVRSETPSKTPTETNHEDASIKVEEVFEIFKNGAKDMYKNIKKGVKIGDSSSEQNQPLRFKMITNRLAVMDNLNDERMVKYEKLIKEKFLHGNYRVFNLSSKPYHSIGRFEGKFFECRMDLTKFIRLDKVVEVCLRASLWLAKSKDNVCIFQCDDGRNLSGFIVCCLLCLSKVFDNPSPAIQLFASRCSNPNLTQSQVRYISYMSKLARTPREVYPHHQAVKFQSIEISPIPLFNRQKNGCRPYVMVYANDRLVFTNLSTYHDLKEFNVEFNSIRFNMRDVYAYGDLTFIVYHARSGHQDSEMSKNLDSSVSSMKICEFRLSTAMLNKDMHKVKITKKYLDNLSESNQMAGFTKRYSDDFHVKLSIEVSNIEFPHMDNILYPWDFHSLDLDSANLFESGEEYNSIMADFGRFNLSDDKSHGVDLDDQVPVVEEVNISSEEEVPKFSKKPSFEENTNPYKTTKEEIFENKMPMHEPETSKPNPEDNIFEVLNNRPKTSEGNKPHHKKANHSADTFTNDWFGFESTSQPPPSNSSSTNPFFNLNEDEDESFLNFQSAKPTSNNPSSNLFNEDINDLFSTNSSANNKPNPNTSSKADPFASANFSFPESQPTYSQPKHEPKAPPPPKSSATPRPTPSSNANKSSDFFEDLLGDFKPKENGKPDASKTVNELLKEKSRANLDPESKRVLEWSDGKQKNIRSLLCTLPNILWDGTKWTQVTINDLLTPEQVKKTYKKAARCVHPDKWNNTEKENIAKLVFMELNEAMVEFEKM